MWWIDIDANETVYEIEINVEKVIDPTVIQEAELVDGSHSTRITRPAKALPVMTAVVNQGKQKIVIPIDETTRTINRHKG